MTPNGIEMLIHFYCSSTPHPRLHAPAVAEEIESLLMNKLIEPDSKLPNVFRTTERGAMHIRQLCATAWPVAAWLDSSGKVIEG